MKKYSVYLWGIITLIFVSLIAIMSYWYPVTLDEFFRWGTPFEWEMIKDSYFRIVPRISAFFSIPVFALGKWSFVLANSLIQLGNCFCIFYILFVRLPNFKDLKDMPYFIMILCMSIFFVCKPSEVMFWISGAMGYTWIMFFFLIMLCFLRQIQINKIIFKDNWIVRTCVFILGFIVGMSHECLAPVALGLAVCFGLFLEYKKIKTPRTLSFLIFGLVIGCLVFFSAPAHYNKMLLPNVTKEAQISLVQKLFFHVFHLNEFFKAQFYLFFVTIIFLLIAFADRDKKNIEKLDLWNSLFSLMFSFGMAFILFLASRVPLRAYYPASVLCLIAFLFLVKYYIHAYKFDFSKWLCYVVLAISLFLSPRFILPHYALYVQDDIHYYLLSQPKPIIAAFIVLAGPTYNLSIGLMDPARRVSIGNDLYTAEASPLVNW